MEIKIADLKDKADTFTLNLERRLRNILHQIVTILCDDNNEIIFENHLHISCDDLCPTWLAIKRIYIDKNNEVIIDDDNNGEWNYHSLSVNELNAIIKKLN
jgi:hypothetical protein